MSKKKSEKNKELRYCVELTKNQLSALEHGCEQLARMIVGQDFIYQEVFEQAWDKNVREKNGYEVCGPEWREMRNEVESICARLKKLCWNMDGAGVYGIKYSEQSDILFDMYQAFRYQRYLDMSPEDKEICKYTVLSDSPMGYSSEPLPKITHVKDNTTTEKKSTTRKKKDVK